MPIYALVMDNPGRYLVGHSDDDIDRLDRDGVVYLYDAAHLMVLKGQIILTPIDVVTELHVRVDHYVGYGHLNDAFQATYEQWLEARRNPPDFEVEDSE